MLVHIVAPIGPNPAALTELVWHVAQVERAHIGSVRVVVESARALRYLEREVLGDAWEQLRALCGERVPALDRVHVARAEDGEGALPADEHGPELADALREPLWRSAREAQRAAGDDSVVFALSGGRRRASTALQATVFQLLGRAQDRLVDVRVDPPIAEGGTGFFFPAQREADLVGVGRFDGVPFSARDVAVRVEAIAIPRLRPLLDERHLLSFATALARSEAVIREAAPPSVVIDIAKPRVLVDGVEMKLSLDQFVLYAAVLLEAMHGRRMLSRARAPLRGVLARAAASGSHWPAKLISKLLKSLRDDSKEPTHANVDLSELTSKMAGRVGTWCRKHRPFVEPWLKPDSNRTAADGGFHYERFVRLPPDRITVLGDDPRQG